MLSKKLEAALNKQINEEFYSSYIYMAMAAYLEDANLDGCAHWMRMQAQEEHLHAMKLFDYMTERGGRVELQPVAAPPKVWDSPLDAREFQGAWVTYWRSLSGDRKLGDLKERKQEFKVREWTFQFERSGKRVILTWRNE